MQQFASSLVNKSVLSFHSGQIVGKITKFLVNQDNFKIELLEIVETESKSPKYLSTNDVRSAIDRLVIINSEDDIAESEDIIRQKELIKSGFNILGSKVITQDGKYVGKANDFTIDYDNFTALKIYVKGGLLKRLMNVNFIIDRNQIIEVRNGKIIIKNAAIKSKQKQTNVLPVKAN